MSDDLGIAPIKDLEFSAQVSGSGRVLHTKLVGNADLNVKTELDRFIGEVHERARKDEAEEVLVDLRGLEFMNSSCLKSFVWWISAAQDLGAGAQYRITFLSSPSMYWQRRSLNALSCLAPDLVSVQV